MRSLDYTDGWHPTVNPSARMPIHHFRFAELLGRNHGVLNEMPRRNGGSTLRVLRIANRKAKVVELPGTLEWMAWWLPADDPWAAGLITKVYQQALSSDIPAPAERAVFGQVLEEFEAECAHPELTVGEALWRIMDRLHRRIVPGLPPINLTSITRSSVRHVLADALACTPSGLISTLTRWATAEDSPIWPMLAVATGIDGRPRRIRLHTRTASLDAEPLVCDPATERTPGKPTLIAEEDLIDLLRTGQLIPGSRLVALAEAVLCSQSWIVRHFGNTYGHTASAGRVLAVPQASAIPCCPDDEDSWHYADLAADHLRPGQRYPLHLLDVAASTPDAQAYVRELVNASLTTGAPVHLDVGKDLDETIRRGRS